MLGKQKVMKRVTFTYTGSEDKKGTHILALDSMGEGGFSPEDKWPECTAGPAENYKTLSRTVRRGRDSSVGIATRYGLDGPGIESRCGRDFPHPSRPGPTQPRIRWVRE